MADEPPEGPVPVEEEAPAEGADAAAVLEDVIPNEGENEETPEEVKEEEPPAPPPPPANEKIFLLEFIVDQLDLEFCLEKNLKNLEGQVCVCFSFLNNGPFCVCEEDFRCKRNYTESVPTNPTKSGKSCLFSLTEAQVEEVRTNFLLEVEVNKKPAGQEPVQRVSRAREKKKVIGKTQISVKQLFNQLMFVVENSEGPVYNKMFKDCFKLTDGGEETIGHLSAYIRLSCFGKMIVNQFQMNPVEETVNYKSYKGHYLYKYKKNNSNPDFRSLCPGLCANPCPANNQQEEACNPCSPKCPPPCPPPDPCPPTCPKNRPVIPITCHPSCLEQAACKMEREKYDAQMKPPCILGKVKCSPPDCCHPKLNGPMPVCSPPRSSGISPNAPCPMRTQPCCALRCDLGPKTCPCQQRTLQTETDEGKPPDPPAKGKKGKGKK